MSPVCKSCTVLSWNVRGLGDPDKCTIVRNAISLASPSVACLQESKLCELNCFKARSFLPTRLPCFLCINAVGSRGGIVTAWDSAVFSLASSISRPYSLTTTLTSPLTNTALTITNVYAPSNHQDSPAFLAELADLLPSISGPWLLVGDFNLLRGAADKNQGHLDNHLCSLFNNTLDCLGVVELQLQDCLFTWSNMRSAPTLARLDRAFVNNDHTSSFPSTTLTTLPRLASDHKPLLVSMSTSIPKSRVFRFENAWLHHPLFLPDRFFAPPAVYTHSNSRSTSTFRFKPFTRPLPSLPSYFNPSSSPKPQPSLRIELSTPHPQRDQSSSTRLSVVVSDNSSSKSCPSSFASFS
jgi:exonuclease III